MRILCAFIFMCVLQSVSLEKAEPITTQQKQDVTKPKIPPETNPEAAVEQTPDVNLEKGADALSEPKPRTEADKSPDTLSEPKSESDADQRSDVEETTDSDIKSTTESPNTNSQQNPANTPEKGQAKPKETGTKPTKPEPRPTKPEPKSTKEDFFWGPPQCEQQNYTRLSCSKVFCPPWRRCIAGVCVCQMPYKCPRQDTRACTLDGAEFYSMCQTNAIACRANKPTFSHFSRTCKTDENVQTTFRNSGDKRVLEIHSKKGKMLVCGSEWNIAAANVFCRNDSTEYYRGAERASKMQYVELEGEDWPDQCMKVRCTGSELSLAECTIYSPTPIKGKQQVAVANCYNETTKEQSMKFRCVNGKYVNYGKLCDGIDDCGDNSDEMCCQDCQKKNNAFWCPSGVCIPRHAVRDGVRDCLGGEDELEENGPIVENDPKEFFTDPLAEIKKIRSAAESKLQCGVPNMDYVYKAADPVPRSLNSDISYFGVGGKQAVFYIGQSVRMISKPASSPDVHEFIMSKDDFERKERNKEDIYSGFIRNRKPGDCSHVDKSEEMFLQSIMREEIGKESFTAVVITGIQQEHINYLKQHFILWTRELAHTYHYYIHGVDGNVKNEMKKTESSSNIDIQISLFERSTRVPRIINLREVDNDMQTLYVRSSANTFEFKATGAKDSLVEGLIRYHPFLYDRETFPVDPYAASAEDEDEELEVLNPEGRGKRPIFECFWNGRLIPYTTVSEFPWCERPKKGGIVPLECYNRISGVLFANDRFQVSTNKLTFMDLELQLRDKDTIFNNGQGQRVNIEKEFTNWLKTCHESFDKQVMFQGYISNVTRTDVATKRQFPWAGFEAIQWDGKTYKRGQYVKTVKTKPILYGSILQFLLYGACDGDVYATGGFAQIALEPKELYDEKKVIPISKIDRMATAKAIEENIENELAKLPDQLKITWPEGNAWEDKDAYPAGTPMGPIKVEILNRKGYSISRLPGTGNIKKLVVELTVTRQSPKKDDQTKKDVQTNSHIAVHSTKWEYWFKTMENLTKIGKYTLHLQTKLSDSSESHWVGKKLPNYTLNFSIKEGKAESFKIGQVSSPVLVGVPFSVPLDFRDQFEYSTQPPSGIKPQLECSSLKLSYDGIAFGTTAVINNVRALGKIKQQGKKHTVKVRIPGLKQDIDSFQLALEPGPPHTLVVFPDGDVLSVENGTPVNFKVEVHDECQNITAHPKLAVRCQMMGAPDLPVDIVDCSNTGSGLMLTKPLSLKTVNAEQIFTVKFNIPNHRTVSSVERQLRVLPSTRISRIEVYRQEEGSDDVMVLQNSERIDWTAGDTLGNLYFRLYDEGNRLVSLQPKITSKIKVNWTAKLNAEDLAQGKLPCLGVPTQAQREHFYHVSFQDQHAVNMSFIIVPRPDEPERLRVRLGESTVKMGEVLSGSTYVEVMDQYGNKTDRLDAESVNSLSVSADGLDNEALAVEWQARAGHFCVSGIRFVSGSPGSRELSFQLQRMKEFVRVDVTAGAPAQIKLLEELEMPLQVMNGHGLETPLTMQLCDQWGNASPDQRVNIVLKTRTSQLKIKSSVSSQPVDSKGKACFVLEAISGPKGEHELEFRGFFSRNGIPGPIIKLNLIPDPNKPVKLCVEYDSRVTLCAGDIFPDFMVVVKSEEGSAVKNICPANLSMLLWKGTASGSCPPAAASTLKCSKRKDSEKDDSFCFRDKQIPELAGQYVVQFVLALDQTKHLWSKQIPLNVFANKATKLAPEIPPATPVVSNSNVRANRTLLYSLTLKIMDQYSNVAGEGLDGQVVVTVTGTGDIVIPLFENKEKRRSYSLTNGETVITDLVLLENSPGVDGAEYVLQFSPEIQQTGVSIAPYSLPFRFCNDADHQKVIVTLSKKKDRLSQTIKMFREFFDTNQQLISELECQVRDALHKLNEFKPELKRNGISALSTVSEIEDLINAKKANLTKMENQPRRKCTVPDPFRGSPQVLGKVAHLALVKDDNVAKVISWHLLGDMDCVVTETTSAAKRIYDDTHGRQQVLPLETIFWKPYDKRLPHIRNGSALFRPLGDPVFVKDLLIFPEYAESCNKVFTTLLGDTILIDDLDSANQYRRGVVQNKIQCPTILTRQGERIRCNGKFGGLQNKAPSIEKLRGQVFGAPLPAEYNQTRLQIDLLQQYRVAMQKASTVQADLNSHLMDLQSPIMTQKKQELEEQEVELQEIEKTLARTPEQMSDAVRVKRSLEPESSDTPVLPKRIRRKPLKMDS